MSVWQFETEKKFLFFSVCVREKVLTLVSLSGRYLLHVFMEAGCLEWCVVIGLILREASVIKQVIGFLDSPEVPAETVQGVRSGLLAVDAWASTDWSVSLSLFIYRLPFFSLFPEDRKSTRLNSSH